MLALLTSVGEGATEDLWEGAVDSSRVFWYEGSISRKIVQLLDELFQIDRSLVPGLKMTMVRGVFLLNSKLVEACRLADKRSVDST